MRQLFPEVVDDPDLEAIYRYPADWLAVNFVSSVDGAVEIDGHSQQLSTPPDREIYWLGSDLADVVLLGAGTATVEEFDGIHPNDRTRDRRQRHGLAPVPPIAVVTAGTTLSPDAPVLTQPAVPTIVITCAATPKHLRDAWTAAGGEVVIAGTDAVDLAAARDALRERGLGRIDCEGGPRLFGSLIAAGQADELRLTLSPVLVAGAAHRIAIGAGIEPRALELASVLSEADTLLVRYLIKR
jgi:riboflavin biosynthesis pyrimidine reductase